MKKSDYSSKTADTYSKDAKSNTEKTLILAGNPNVGKSTLFNCLTGQKRHTGNWSGKTVSTAYGTYFQDGIKYNVADIPGCYSLRARSSDEECASDIICNTGPDATVVICDAGALERNLNLVIQLCEAVRNISVCINFADESRKRGIYIDTDKLENMLGVPVAEINARKKTGIENMISKSTTPHSKRLMFVSYGTEIEYALRLIQKTLKSEDFYLNPRHISVRLLEDDCKIWDMVRQKCEPGQIHSVVSAYNKAKSYLESVGISGKDFSDIVSICISATASAISQSVIRNSAEPSNRSKIIADKIFADKFLGVFIMFVLFAAVFYITLKGANYPSAVLSRWFSKSESALYALLRSAHINRFLSSMIVYGGYRVLGWVVSVMLPPMAIFFPLFTLLEDVGYLPRIAFNLDRAFKSCKACGKQALTTCMGFGCNAVGVCGARIIDSPRERLIAILTNTFIPCNGRFPSIICLITIFFASSGTSSAIYLTLFVAFAVIMSMVASGLLSQTLLKGVASSAIFELPPFRRPQITKIIIRSVFDRTVRVLGRAVIVAFPAGIILWLLTNIQLGNGTLISEVVALLDPIGRFLGLDGTIITSFILGLPANEIILPVALMIYTEGTSLCASDGYQSVLQILSSAGWTRTGALCAIIFFLMHWPCSTTIMTIRKETGSNKWTLVSVLLPTIFGMTLCALINFISQMFFV